jgi:ankyrin repeat protein
MRIPSTALSLAFLPVLILALPTSLLAQQESDLVDAVARQDLARFTALLDRGVDVNAADNDGTRALHWAVHRDSAEMTGRLLAAGADVNSKNRYGVAALSLAANNGRPDIVELLLDAGADPNTSMQEGESVLLTAARTGVPEVVQMLIQHGADVDVRESWRGQTPLMWAAAESNLEVIELLVQHGAEIDARSDKGFTALMFAARDGKTDAVGLLLELGADRDAALPSGEAVVNESGMSAAAQTGLTPFLLAAGSGHFETANLLLEAGADPNQAPLGWSALHQVSWVRKAGQAGSNNPAPEGSGKLGSLEFTRILVERGADLNALASSRPPVGVSSLNMIGATPFLLAARTADVDLMRLLVELGADPYITNSENSSALMVAAGLGTGAPGEDPGTESEVLDAVRYALSLGFDINAVDNRGNTAMHGAAYKHVPSVVEHLFEAGAEIAVWNQENAFGYTPLIIAQGIHRGMSIVSSRETEEALRKILDY